MIKCNIYQKKPEQHKKMLLGSIEMLTLPIIRVNREEYALSDGTVTRDKVIDVTWYIEGYYIGKPLLNIDMVGVEIVTPDGIWTGKAFCQSFTQLKPIAIEQPDVVEGPATFIGTGAIEGPAKALKLLGKKEN